MIKKIILLIGVLVLMTTGCAFGAAEAETRSEISIPGFADAELIADESIQPLLMYNPTSNKCTLVYIICLENGMIIWKSDPLKPGYGYKNIKLEQPLMAGEYKAYVAVRCYSLEDGRELNSCKFNCTFIAR